MALFLGPFTSRAGIPLPLRVECDALTELDWRAVAAAVGPRLPAFGRAVGVPRGGVPLALALGEYADPGAWLTVVCEDVLTSGASLRQVMDAEAGPVLGLALFAHGVRPVPPDVRVACPLAPWLYGPRVMG